MNQKTITPSNRKLSLTRCTKPVFQFQDVGLCTHTMSKVIRYVESTHGLSDIERKEVLKNVNVDYEKVQTYYKFVKDLENNYYKQPKNSNPMIAALLFLMQVLQASE